MKEDEEPFTAVRCLLHEDETARKKIEESKFQQAPAVLFYPFSHETGKFGKP